MRAGRTFLVVEECVRSFLVRFAGEQRREVAQGASPGKAPIMVVNLRSSDVYLPVWQNQRRCSAASSYQGHYDLRFHRRLSTSAAPQPIASTARSTN